MSRYSMYSVAAFHKATTTITLTTAIFPVPLACERYCRKPKWNAIRSVLSVDVNNTNGESKKKAKSKTRLSFVRPIVQRQILQYCSNQSCETDEEKEREIERIKQNASLEEPPTACCGSGCANCVLIVWAETLASKMENAGPEIAEKIMKSVDDPSMRAYLELELRIRGLKKE